MQREQAEKLQQAREEKEKHLYTVIKAARDQDMQDQIGSSLFWDLVDFDKVRHSLPSHEISPRCLLQKLDDAGGDEVCQIRSIIGVS